MKHVPDPNKLVLLMFNDFSDFYDEIKNTFDMDIVDELFNKENVIKWENL